jgi:hypothetical protein
MKDDQTIIDFVLSRNAKVSMNTMRAHDYINQNVNLNEDVLYLLPFDDKHKSKIERERELFEIVPIITESIDDEEFDLSKTSYQQFPYGDYD